MGCLRLFQWWLVGGVIMAVWGLVAELLGQAWLFFLWFPFALFYGYKLTLGDWRYKWLWHPGSNE